MQAQPCHGWDVQAWTTWCTTGVVRYVEGNKEDGETTVDGSKNKADGLVRWEHYDIAESVASMVPWLPSIATRFQKRKAAR